MGFAALRCLSHRSLAGGRESREPSTGRGREGGQVRDAAAEESALHEGRTGRRRRVCGRGITIELALVAPQPLRTEI